MYIDEAKGYGQDAEKQPGTASKWLTIAAWLGGPSSCISRAAHALQRRQLP